MEKRGVIAKGITPPEEDAKNLEDHVTKRAADQILGTQKPDGAKPQKATATIKVTLVPKGR